ncbi:MAG: hypothetical protein H7Y27_07550, partial [Gemmatimonadaceae bacterium]|nr:hypothetical protein [Chitinophagaceae bacterium]
MRLERLLQTFSKPFMPSKKNIRLGSGPVFIILIIALVAAAGFGAWRYYKYKLVNQEVKKGIYENSNGLYKVTYDNLKIDEAAGFLYVTNLVITPDTALFRKMIKENKNPPLILRVTIPELKVTGVKTPKALLEKNIEGSKLEIKSPDILIYFAKRPTDSVKRPDSREMYEQILGNLKRIKVDSVEITNSSLAFSDIRTETKTITGENINIHLRDILIDSTSFEDKTRFFFAKNVDVDLEKGVLKNKTGTYQYLFDAVSFSNTQRTFTVKKVHIKPVLGEAAFVKKARLQTDRFDFIFNDVSFKNIDLDKLMDESFYADTLIVRDANVKIFRDLSYPRDKVDRRGGYPQQMLMKMDLPVAIKKLVFRSAFIEYKEF